MNSLSIVNFIDDLFWTETSTEGLELLMIRICTDPGQWIFGYRRTANIHARVETIFGAFMGAFWNSEANHFRRFSRMACAKCYT